MVDSSQGKSVRHSNLKAMKETCQRKTFWVILVILLLAVFIYPPFIRKYRNAVERDWGFVFSPPAGMEIDLKILLDEAVIATLLTIGICLIPFRRILQVKGEKVGLVLILFGVSFSLGLILYLSDPWQCLVGVLTTILIALYNERKEICNATKELLRYLRTLRLRRR
jgi:hypothetical protein